MLQELMQQGRQSTIEFAKRHLTLEFLSRGFHTHNSWSSIGVKLLKLLLLQKLLLSSFLGGVIKSNFKMHKYIKKRNVSKVANSQNDWHCNGTIVVLSKNTAIQAVLWRSPLPRSCPRELEFSGTWGQSHFAWELSGVGIDSALVSSIVGMIS